MDNNQPIPEEVKEWIRRELEKYSIPLAMAGFEQGSEAMYRRLAAEMETLREERYIYRKALEEVIEAFPWSWQASHAKKVLDQYPSPKNSDNGQ